MEQQKSRDTEVKKDKEKVGVKEKEQEKEEKQQPTLEHNLPEEKSKRLKDGEISRECICIPDELRKLVESTINHQ